MTCTTGKHSYPSPQAAQRVLSQVLRRHRKRPWNNGKPGVYQCPHCKQWHTTNSVRREDAA